MLSYIILKYFGRTVFKHYYPQTLYTSESQRYKTIPKGSFIADAVAIDVRQPGYQCRRKVFQKICKDRFCFELLSRTWAISFYRSSKGNIKLCKCKLQAGYRILLTHLCYRISPTSRSLSCCNRNRNLKTSKALLKSQAHQGTSLFTSAATNQRGVSKGGSREAQVRIPEYQEGTE